MKKFCEECLYQHRLVTQRRNHKNWYAKNKKLDEQGIKDLRERQSQATKRAWEEGLLNKDGLAIGANRTKEERAAAWTPEKRAAQGQKTLQAYKDGRMEIHGRYKGRWTVYEGIKGAINMRSKSETLFAYHLDKIGMDWLFEPKRFDLGWATYTPDFYLPSIDLWIEVKGGWTEDSKRKFDEFGTDYPIMAVRAHDLLNFEKKYPH